MRTKTEPKVLRPPPTTPDQTQLPRKRHPRPVFSPADVNGLPGTVFKFTPFDLRPHQLTPTFEPKSDYQDEPRPAKKPRNSYVDPYDQGIPPKDITLPLGITLSSFQRDSADAFGRWCCRHPGCYRTFSCENDRGYHMRTHVLGREAPSFRCKICGVAFGRLDALKLHQSEVDCTINASRNEDSPDTNSDAEDRVTVKEESRQRWTIPWLEIKPQNTVPLKKRPVRNHRHPELERPTSPPSSGRSSTSPAPLQSEDDNEPEPQSSPPPSPHNSVNVLPTTITTTVPTIPTTSDSKVISNAISTRTTGSSSTRASSNIKATPSSVISSRATGMSLSRPTKTPIKPPTKTSAKPPTRATSGTRLSRATGASSAHASTITAKPTSRKPYPVRALRPTANRRASGNLSGTTTTHSCASCRQLLVDPESTSKSKSKSQSKTRTHSPSLTPMANLPATWGPNAQLCLACSVQYARCRKRCTVCFYVPCEWEEDERWCSRCKGGTWLNEKNLEEDMDEDKEDEEEWEERDEVIVEREN
ncbi:hypothetical protein BC936DRAFT_140843 [Jimgerdemannia flammicorona]|uniref:C2H2-type domain-containing protein n=1 Tax=Jimgerdemannia flammicorona TaxID=994334 RepID=A0A433A3B7_9FUNG|nr:hypothetical protein BC936DRAFT_140843 [Jimgerdemannia flammicorona]